MAILLRKKCIFAMTVIGILMAHYANAYVPTYGPNNVQLAVVGYSEIDLTWSTVGASPSVSGYKIERESPVGGGFTTIVANTNSTAVSYADTNLSPSTTYGYRVYAINSEGTGPASTIPASVTTLSAPSPTPPSRPLNLTATATSASEIALSWTVPKASPTPILGYKIEREFSGDFSVIVPNTNSISTIYTDSGLSSGVAYRYRVSAINTYGTSDPSIQAIAATFAIPGAPQNVTAVAGDKQVTLSWLPPLSTGGNVANYAISWTSDSFLSGNTTSTTTSTTITGLKNGVTYFFSVNTVNGAGTGQATKSNPATPQAAPTPITQTPVATTTTTSSTAPPIPTASKTEISTQPTSTPIFRFNSTLQVGKKGGAVTELQKFLSKKGFYSGEATGYFGPMTKKSLQAYQRAHSIQTTGILGPLTRAYVNAGL